MRDLFNRPLPAGLEGLRELALDIRWSWSHGTDRLWELLDRDTFERTNNPHLILQNVSAHRLEAAARDPVLKQELKHWLQQRQEYLDKPGWYGRTYPVDALRATAYFSMEFGLTDALPIYSGGLGILAGDHLKTASDLGVPLYGIGLLYQQGFFRQVLSPDGWQLEAFPFNDPTSLPVVPLQNHEGGWLRIKLELPGRTLLLRVWQAVIGKVRLYLLDSNDPLNSPWDRAITANLYAPGLERRFLQEVVLGVGGWQVMEQLGIDVDVCHLNEGHAAFAILARTRSFMQATGQSFAAALWATRAGNVFTTHTPVDAAFDRFEPALLEQFTGPVVQMLGISLDQLLALGRRDPDDRREPFTMTYLALRGCGYVNGVSELHGRVSRHLFEVLFPGWPHVEVPVGHVTNGVHAPSWDTEQADALWCKSCGDDVWMGTATELADQISRVTDEELWNFRAAARRTLIDYVRRRLIRQLRQRGTALTLVERAAHVPCTFDRE